MINEELNKFKPFENDSQVTLIGPGDGLNVENGTEMISIFGDISVCKGSKKDKEQLQEVIDLLNKIKDSI